MQRGVRTLEIAQPGARARQPSKPCRWEMLRSRNPARFPDASRRPKPLGRRPLRINRCGACSMSPHASRRSHSSRAARTYPPIRTLAPHRPVV